MEGAWAWHQWEMVGEELAKGIFACAVVRVTWSAVELD